MNELRDHGSRMHENDISALLRRFVFHTETARNASDTRVTGDEAQGTAFLNA